MLPTPPPFPITNTSKKKDSMCRALLRSGSQLNSVTEDIIQSLGLKGFSQIITIKGIGNVVKSSKCWSVKTQMKTEMGIINFTAYVLPVRIQFMSLSEFSIEKN